MSLLVAYIVYAAVVVFYASELRARSDNDTTVEEREMPIIVLNERYRM